MGYNGPQLHRHLFYQPLSAVVMERFARIVVGYHGCERRFAIRLLVGKLNIAEWEPSENDYDWLGKGIYFWEHAPERALRWAKDRFDAPSVMGAVIQLGKCFDLTNEDIAEALSESFAALKADFKVMGWKLPTNTEAAGKKRELDCLVINDCLDKMAEAGQAYDSVRGAFLEGEPLFDGTTLSKETHIQVAVRNPSCILGVFRPNYS